MAILGLKGGVLSAFNIFVEGIKIDGVTKVIVPEYTPITTTIKGTGISGEIDIPIRGKFPSITMKLIVLNSLKEHVLRQSGLLLIRLKANFQYLNMQTGQPMNIPLEITAKALFKSKTSTAFEVGGSIEEEYTYEIISWTELHQGVPMFVMDKLNGIYQEGTSDNSLEKINIGEI